MVERGSRFCSAAGAADLCTQICFYYSTLCSLMYCFMHCFFLYYPRPYWHKPCPNRHMPESSHKLNRYYFVTVLQILKSVDFLVPYCFVILVVHIFDIKRYHYRCLYIADIYLLTYILYLLYLFSLSDAPFKTPTLLFIHQNNFFCLNKRPLGISCKNIYQ